MTVVLFDDCLFASPPATSLPAQFVVYYKLNVMLRKIFLLAGLTLCISFNIFGQVVTSAQSGYWNSPETWVGGVVPTFGNCTNVQIQHNIVIADNVVISAVNVNASLTIEQSGTLDLTPKSGSGALVITASGTCTVAGAIVGRDNITFTSNASNLKFLPASTFQFAGGSKAGIPIANWDISSNLSITGFVGSGYIAIAYSNPWKQKFGNVIYNCPLQTSFVDLNGYLHDITGDLIIRNTNKEALRLSTTQKPEIRIGGNFVIEGPSEVWFNTTGDSTKLYIGKNFEYRSTSTGPSYFATRGRCFMAVGGKFILGASGPLRICSGSADSTGIRKSSIVLFNGLEISSGSLIAPNPGKGTIIFDGVADQKLLTTATAYNGNFDFHFRPGSIVSFGQSVIANTNGNLYMRGHIRLGSTHINGALQTVSAGNVLVKGSRTYYAGSTIEYNGSATQFIGAGHPSNSNIKLVCNNSAGVNALQNIVAGNIEVSSGKLSLLGYAVSASGNIIVNPPGSIEGKVVCIGAIDQQLSLSGSTLTNLTLNKTTNHKVTLTSPLAVQDLLAILSVNTELAANGFLTLLSSGDAIGQSASVAALPLGSSISGNVIVQRHISAEGQVYRYISSPVVAAEVSQLQDDFSVTGKFLDPSKKPGIISTFSSLFQYNAGTSGTYGWNPYPASGYANDATLVPGRGYTAYLWEGKQEVVWDVKGVLNQGQVELPLAYNPAVVDYQGWNLVGNPYAATIDWSTLAGWQKSEDLSFVFAIRDNPQGRFHYSDGEIGDLAKPHIAAGQAFWVHASAVNPFLRVNESAKVNTSAEFFRTSPQEKVIYLKIELSRDSISDVAFVRERRGSSRTIDRADAPKMSNDVFSLSFLTSDKIHVAINAVDSFSCVELFPLSFDFARKANGTFMVDPRGTYSVSITPFSLFQHSETLLIDHYTGDTVRTSTYAFVVNDDKESYAPDRFSLLINTAVPEQPVFIVPERVCPNTNAIISVQSSGRNAEFILWNETVEIPVHGDTVVIPHQYLDAKENIFYLKARNLCSSAIVDTVVLKRAPKVAAPEIDSLVICYGNNTQTTQYEIDELLWFDDADLKRSVSEIEAAANAMGDSSIIYAVRKDSFNCRSNPKPVSVLHAFRDTINVAQHGNFLISGSGPLDWFFQNELLKTNSVSYGPQHSGIFIAAREHLGCRQEALITFLKTPEISAWPIPFKDVLHLRIDDKHRMDQVYILYSHGNVVKKIDNSDTSSMIIDTSELATGVYFLKIVSGSFERIVRIVK